MPETAEVDPVESFLDQARLDQSRFICETYHCLMLRSSCIARRTQARSSLFHSSFSPGAGDEGCRWCRQGAEIAGFEFTPPKKFVYHIPPDNQQEQKIPTNKKVVMEKCSTPGCLGMISPRNKSKKCSDCAKKAFDIVYRKRDRKAKMGESCSTYQK